MRAWGAGCMDRAGWQQPPPLRIPTLGPPSHGGSWPLLTVALLASGATDPPVRILERDALPTCRRCRAMEDLVLEVQLSHAHGEVKWYKDGEKLQDTGHVRLEEDGQRRALVILGATGRDAGEYLCDTHDDSVIFCVTVEGNRKHMKRRWAEWAGRAPGVTVCLSSSRATSENRGEHRHRRASLPGGWAGPGAGL